ncbi:MAG: GGDEF domain-containing protein [Bacillota bacterium]
MKILKKWKLDIFKILLGVFIVSAIALSMFVSTQQNILDTDMAIVARVETIGSGVQRIAKLELENNPDDELLQTLRDSVNEVEVNEEYASHFPENPETITVLDDYIENFHDFDRAITKYHENKDRDAFFLVSENNYEISSSAARTLYAYVIEVETEINQYRKLITGNVIAIAIVLLKILIDTLAELKRNKKLSEGMFIDASTGIYNRAKCQEVLASTDPPKAGKERAIIIFDLNDLKKTNDNLGHRAGDSLIANFAHQLKEATHIFSEEVVVGRYGGDEFMAFFQSTTDREVNLYLEEVQYLIDKFNESGVEQFTLSCAAGYSITSKERPNMTNQEIFDEADEDMYKNKIEMKRKKKEALEAQGIEVPDHVDDRL